ncbi:hypothetical protein CsSME_00029809 [Camellia sinensis var. sinensis]
MILQDQSISSLEIGRVLMICGSGEAGGGFGTENKTRGLAAWEPVKAGVWLEVNHNLTCGKMRAT